mmetsp:Transcript_5310/g.4982  ORF Transcript_5310/g.4982 Transcript_5310/m.4982 type:complete len:97 (+) Transcript_5310:515-805(+)
MNRTVIKIKFHNNKLSEEWNRKFHDVQIVDDMDDTFEDVVLKQNKMYMAIQTSKGNMKLKHRNNLVHIIEKSMYQVTNLVSIIILTTVLCDMIRSK